MIDLHLPASDYHALPAVSASALRIIHAQTPFHLWRARQDGVVETDAMRLGTLIHDAVLEPHKAGRSVAVIPETFTVPADYQPKNKKDIQPGEVVEWSFRRPLCQKWKADMLAAGCAVVTKSEWDEIQQAASAVANSSAGDVVRRSDPEVTITWETDRGTKCKARIDLLPRDSALGIWDLKTCSDASPDGFQRAAWASGYHIQAAWYLDAIRLFDESRAEEFRFIAYEKGSGAVVVHKATPEFISAGRRDYLAALEKYEAAVASGVWPGYADEVVLDVPKWEKRKESHGY